MKCIRKILGVSWTQNKTNEWVLEMAEVERDLLNLIKRRILSYLGHVMRKVDCMEKVIMKGTVLEAREQGRPKMRWIDNIEKWAGMSFEKLLGETGQKEMK